MAMALSPAAASDSGMRKAEKSGSYYDRIHRLSERLSGLQSGLEQERTSRFDQLSTRMQDVDARLSAAQEAAQAKASILKEQLSKFQTDFEEERLSRESMQESKSRELSGIDMRLQQALEP